MPRFATLTSFMSATPEARPPGSTAVGILTILCSLAGWTSIPLFLKHFAGEIDPYTANGWRYAFSALLWLPPLILAWRRGSLPPDVWRAALWPAFFNIIAQHAFGIAPYKMDPGLMTFALRAQVIFVTIGAAVMFAAERRVIKTPAYLTGLFMVLGGTILTLWLRPGGIHGEVGIGAVWAIIAGAGYAAYALSVRKLMHGMNPLLAFAAVSQYTAIALVGVMLIAGKDHGATAWHLPNTQFTLLMLSAVIGIGFGHTCYFLAIQRLGLAVANAVVQLQPITVSLASMMIFGEKLTTVQWVTGTIAIAGAGLILWAQSRTAARPPAP